MTKKPDKEEFILIRKRARYLADLQGLTLTDLARKLRISYAVLQHFLRGHPVSTAHNLRERITRIVGADPWQEGEYGFGRSQTPPEDHSTSASRSVAG